MTDEYTGSQAEGAGVDDPQASDATIEFEGQAYTPQQFVEKHNAAIKGMNEAQQRAAGFEKDITGMRQWADPMREAYNADPNVKQFWDNWHAGQPYQTNQLDPRTRELDEIRQQNLQLQWRFQLQDLQNQLGVEISPEMGQKLNEEMVKGNFRDPVAAYKSLAYDEHVAKAGNEGRRDAANKLASNKAAYQKPPSPGGHKTQKVDTKGMSREKKEAEYMKVWGDADFSPD
jgi:hypothetical protein